MNKLELNGNTCKLQVIEVTRSYPHTSEVSLDCHFKSVNNKNKHHTLCDLKVLCSIQNLRYMLIGLTVMESM